MKLLFVHGTKIKEDSNGVYYTGGSYSQSIWNRYLSISSQLSIIARKDPIIYESEYARRNFNYYNKEKIYLVEIPNLVSSIKTFFNIQIHKAKKEKIKEAVLNNDCIIARLPSSNGNIAISMARKYNKPYLIELVGCPWDALWNHSWKGKLVAPFMWYATKKAVKNAPYVLYVSSNFLQKRYPNNFNNISCSDVDLQPVKQDVLDQRLEKIKNMNKNKPLVLCTIANVDVKYKRQDLVIKAISELNIQGYNFEYRLVGGGNTNHLQSIAEKYGVVDKVIFEGSVPHEKVFDYLDDIDIYIQPSDAESHGRVILEAMSRGCPCIGSSTGGIPELIDASFIFKRRNVNELIDILAGFDKEKMIKQAKRNFEFSKGYAKEIIETRRNEFFKEFAESVRNS